MYREASAEEIRIAVLENVSNRKILFTKNSIESSFVNTQEEYSDDSQDDIINENFKSKPQHKISLIERMVATAVGAVVIYFVDKIFKKKKFGNKKKVIYQKPFYGKRRIYYKRNKHS